MGDGNKLKGILRRLQIQAQRRPKDAFDKWRQHVDNQKNRGLLLLVTANKLRNSLEKIPKPTLKNAFDRIIGGGDRLLGMLRRLAIQAQRRPKEAFDKWKQHTDNQKNRGLLLLVAANKLRNSLENIPRRTLRDAESRILGGGNKIAGVIRRLAI